jgi:hypothetical protein
MMKDRQKTMASQSPNDERQAKNDGFTIGI